MEWEERRCCTRPGTQSDFICMPRISMNSHANKQITTQSEAGPHYVTFAELRVMRQAIGLLGGDSIRRLHRHMFGDVWEWAGGYRQTAQHRDSCISRPLSCGD